MPDVSDQNLHDQMGHFAESIRKAITADRIIIIAEFFDEKVERPANLMVFADNTDQDEANTFAEITHALLNTAQTVLAQTETELMLRDRKTGELIEFNVWRPHALELRENMGQLYDDDGSNEERFRE